MSRRFGRNQRRRAREALEETSRALDNLTAHYNLVASLNDKQQEQLLEASEFQREVAEIVGRYAIIAGEPILLKGIGFDRMRLPILRDSPCVSSLFEPKLAIEHIRDETMRLLSIEAVRALVRFETHVLVNLDDKSVGYAISESALRKMTTREIERTITPQVTRLLVQAIKAAK